MKSAHEIVGSFFVSRQNELWEKYIYKISFGSSYQMWILEIRQNIKQYLKISEQEFLSEVLAKANRSLMSNICSPLEKVSMRTLIGLCQGIGLIHPQNWMFRVSNPVNHYPLQRSTLLYNIRDTNVINL